MSSVRKRVWNTPTGESKSAWLVDYKDSAGHRRSKQFDRKKDADVWSTKASWEVSQGIHTADSQSITVSLAAKQWLERAHRDGLEPTTIAAYEQHVRLHIEPLCAAVKLTHLTTPMVESYRDKLVDQLSKSMAVRVMRSLSSIISEAMRRGQVSQNVARYVKVNRSARHRTKVVIPSKSTLKAALAIATEHEDHRGSALLILAMLGGLRASELRGLAWSAIDLEACTVSVVRRADAKGILGSPKSVSGYRTVPMAKSAIAILRNWKIGCPDSPEDLVFPSVRDRKPMSNRFMTLNILSPILERANVPSLRLHDLRHAAVSLWIEQRVDAKRVQTWIGHQSVQLTFDIYGHLFEATDRESNIAEAIAMELIV